MLKIAEELREILGPDFTIELSGTNEIISAYSQKISILINFEEDNLTVKTQAFSCTSKLVSKIATHIADEVVELILENARSTQRMIESIEKTTIQISGRIK